MAKRGRRVGEQRARRLREHAARQARDHADEDQLRRRCAELEATIATAPERSEELLDPTTQARLDSALVAFERRSQVELESSCAKLVTATTVADRHFAAAARIVASDLTSAELALDQAVARVRSGDRSRKHIVALARAIAAELDAVANVTTPEARARKERLRSLGHILLELAAD